MPWQNFAKCTKNRRNGMSYPSITHAVPTVSGNFQTFQTLSNKSAPLGVQGGPIPLPLPPWAPLATPLATLASPGTSQNKPTCSNMGTQRSIKGEKLDPNLANMNQIRFQTSPSGFPGPFESRFQGCPNPRKSGLPRGFHRDGIFIIPAL